MYNYKFRNQGVKIREAEVNSIVEDFLSSSGNRTLGEKWLDVKYSNVALFGHSFGGITVLGASSNPKVQAVVSMDPWFFPRSKDNIKAHDSCKSYIIMNDHFPAEVLKG